MRGYLVFISAGLGILMFAIDATAVAVAFPDMIRDLGTSVLWVAWTVSIYLIGNTVAMPIAGNIGDSFGRKKVFLISLVLFTASSLACGLAPNIHVLIACRFIQGIGGASFLPTTSGIVSDHFPEHRQTALGLFISIFHIGGIIGPNLGGWIVSQYSWRYIFYINIPIGIVLIALVMVLIKDPRLSSRRHVDFAGTSFFTGAILFLMFGLNLIVQSLSVPFLLLATLFLLLSGSLFRLFLHQEKRDPNPMFDMVLLESRPFMAANILNVIIGASVMGVITFIPLYATSVHKLSTLMSGVILTPRSVGVIAASVTTSFLLRRWGYRWPMLWGFAIVSFSTILLAEGVPLVRMMAMRGGVAETLALVILLSGIGAGIAFPAANNACIELLPDKVGTIVGLRGMFRTVGGALGVSLITSILQLSGDPARGFSVSFLCSGLVLLLALPLVFLVPPGNKELG